MVDPVFGRAVFVPDRILAKIERDHGPAYSPRREEILDVVREPTLTMPGNVGQRHCYAREMARLTRLTRWLFVVVDYDQRSVGQVVTAFPRRRLPRS